MKRKSKREMVFEIYDREAMGEVTAHEIATINRGLIAEFGEGGALEPAEIASILNDEDLPVRFDQIFRMSSIRERYENLFENALKISSLNEAEISLQKLDSLYRKFARLNDRRGMRYARTFAQNVKNTANASSQDKRLRAKQRAEQAEIALWLTIWLQTPDLFNEWLELRKRTSEYQEKFPLHSTSSLST